MVRILANGDIVQDDDPRVQQSSHSGNAPTNRGSRMGYIQQNTEPHQYGHDGQGAGGHEVQNVSIFQTLNQRLLDLGIPCFNIGPYTIQPIVTVAFILAMLIFGLPGLLFAGLLFGVVMLSGGGGGGDDGGTGGGGGQSTGRGDGQRRHRGGRVLRHR
ncbi:protein FAM241B-like [Patiria miniata]|uniref:DUF4605 domain-containing protein n=1 Tax=Patiria miniata TaxID=46514 RepID=A0A914ABF7_PATMI|nr:protein FAM241B-like [Patiria miniata]XP_038061235.1 protein FAM241B-like [Patiria miniata]